MESQSTSEPPPASSSSSAAPAPAAPTAAAAVDDRTLRRKLKKERKMLQKGKLAKSTALDVNSLYGPDARPALELKMEKNRRRIETISVEDVQNLLLWVYTQASAPQWVFLKNRALVSGAVLLILREAAASQVVAAAPDMPFLRGLAQARTGMPRGHHWNRHRRELRGVESGLLYLEDSSAAKAARVDVEEEPAAPKPAPAPASASSSSEAAAVTERTPQEHAATVFSMCLRFSELHSNKFPVATASGGDAAAGSSSSFVLTATAAVSASSGELTLPPRHVATKTALADLRHYHAKTTATTAAGDSSASSAATADSAAAAPSRPRLLALDCEMCQTAVGLQLARVTVTGEDDAVVLDALVKPELPVMDHLTQYSGITASMLAGATATLADVQARLVALIDGDGGNSSETSSSPSASSPSVSSPSSSSSSPAVLVGHSLECDLQALRLVHTRVIDTSLLFPHPAGLPYRHALRHLVRTRLGRTIQAGHGTSGHDSVEDTVAAMHLVQSELQAALASADATAAAGADTDVSDVEEEEKEEGGAGGDAAAGKDEDDDASGPPPRKTIRMGDGDVAQAAAAAADALPSAAAARRHRKRRAEPQLPPHHFLRHFVRSGREHMMPPPPPPPAADGGVSVSASSSSRGVAATLAQLSGGGGKGGGPRQGGGGRRPRSLVALPALSDRAVCAGVSLVGSPSFLQAHLAGGASGISLPVSASPGDLQRVLAKASAEAVRLVAARRGSGGGGGSYVGPGLVVAEAVVPRHTGGGSGTGGGQDWRGLDAALASWSAGLPPGTVVLAVTQAKLGLGVEGGGPVAGAGGVDDGAAAAADEPAVPATEAAWGTTFMWVAPWDGASAAPPAVAAGSSAAAGEEGGDDDA